MASGTLSTSDDSLLSTDTPLVTNFARALAASFKTKYAIQFADISTETLGAEVKTLLDTLLPERVTLATTRPDFDSNLLHLMREVERGEAWKDTTLSSTGQMLLRMIATDIDFAQFAVMRALQEAFPHTARNPSSIIAAARGLGTRITRSLPASRVISFSRQDVGTYYQVPAWTQFTIAGVDWFNREAFSYDPSDLVVNPTLYQGTVKSTSVISTGVLLQVLEVGEETYKISDLDIMVLVDGVPWTRTNSSLHNLAPGDQVFWENTLPNGNVEIRFGDGLYGAAPPSGVTISVYWVETEGSGGNDPTTGQKVTYNDEPSGIKLTGLTATAAVDGSDRLPVDYFRIFSGDRRGADAGNGQRAVIRKDFRAHACAFPGVYDAVFRGQAELAPGKRSWTNVLGVTLLTDPVFTPAQWEAFVAYFKDPNEGLCHENLTLLRMDPVARVVNLKGQIACVLNADRDSVKARVINNLVEATRPKIGLLGFSFYKTDWSELLRGNLPQPLTRIKEARSSTQYDLPSLINYAVMDSPSTDTILSGPLEYVKLGTVDLDMVYAARSEYGGKL